MSDCINKKRVSQRGLALLNVYSKNRKVIPSLDTFINDYFKIVDPSKSNPHLIKLTSLTLKSTYEDFMKENKVRVSVTVML